MSKNNVFNFPSEKDFSQIQQQIDDMKKSFTKGGGGGDNGDMEARIAKLESTVEYVQRDISEIKADIKDIRTTMRSDFKWLLGVYAAGILGLAGLMAKGFGWL